MGNNRLECTELLLLEGGARINVREAKGWTPIAMAAFHGLKKMCLLLMAMHADPDLQNAYRRNAHELAKDDEISEVLREPPMFWQRLRDAESAGESGAACTGEDHDSSAQTDALPL